MNVDNKNRCNICNKIFLRPFLLKRHLSQVHNVIYTPQKRGRPAGNKYICDNCSWTTSSRRYLIRHMNCEHRLEKENRKIKIHCPVEDCSYLTVSRHQLSCHVLQDHNSLVQEGSCITDMSFNSTEEFTCWKSNEERRTNTRYVLNRSPRKNKNSSVSTYFCHRSGMARKRGKGIRHMKIQGSCKINNICPAMMTVTENSGSILVKYDNVHFGHKNEAGHVALTKEEREQIAAQLAMNVPFDTVLKNIRDTLDNSHVSRMHILQRHDLSNIMRDFRLDTDKCNQNDAESLSIIIERFREENDDTVRFVKFQGVTDTTHRLENKDFVLVLMTDVQKEMFMEFGMDRIICVDSTHGTNAYGFALTTVLVLDEYNEGFPVAFCYSNRTDFDVLKCFFSILKSSMAVNNFPLESLMTDDADCFYNAWSNVMGTPKNKLLCSWHVEKAWRKNIAQKIVCQNQELKIVVYKNLKLLMKSENADDFHCKLENFLIACEQDPLTKDFATYFEKEYGNNYKQWAYCYRLGLHINTNNHIESFHRVLKKVIMKGLKINRMDKSVNAVMLFVQNKVFDRLLKLNKGKLTRATQNIRDRHKNSMKMSIDDVQIDRSNDLEVDRSDDLEVDRFDLWKVKSQTADEYYTVHKEITLSDHSKCPLKCCICNICIHQYSCTCCDYMLHTTICKHIHLVVRSLSDNLSMDVTQENTNICVPNEMLLHSLNEPKSSSISKVTEINNMIDQLKTKMLNTEHITDSSTIRYVYNNLSSILGYLNNKESGSKQSCLPKAQYAPPNKIAEKQLRFYSTKKKRKSKLTNFPVPNNKEKRSLEAGLRGTEFNISENITDDHSYL